MEHLPFLLLTSYIAAWHSPQLWTNIHALLIKHQTLDFQIFLSFFSPQISIQGIITHLFPLSFWVPLGCDSPQMSFCIVTLTVFRSANWYSLNLGLANICQQFIHHSVTSIKNRTTPFQESSTHWVSIDHMGRLWLPSLSTVNHFLQPFLCCNLWKQVTNCINTREWRVTVCLAC